MEEASSLTHWDDKMETEYKQILKDILRDSDRT